MEGPMRRASPWLVLSLIWTAPALGQGSPPVGPPAERAPACLRDGDVTPVARGRVRPP